MSSQVARAFTAKWRSKLARVVSRRPESTDSAWLSTSAVTGPMRLSASSKIRVGASGSIRSASIAAVRAPCAASEASMAPAAPRSSPQSIRRS